MATQIPRPLTMNRRQLLGTVPAIPMSGILPPQVSADAVPVPSIPTKRLVYAGHVGTGFDQVALKSIYGTMRPLHTDQKPFD